MLAEETWQRIHYHADRISHLPEGHRPSSSVWAPVARRGGVSQGRGEWPVPFPRRPGKRFEHDRKASQRSRSQFREVQRRVGPLAGNMTPTSAMTRTASGCNPWVSIPAEYGSIRPAFSLRTHPSAIWLRHELPVQRKRIRNIVERRARVLEEVRNAICVPVQPPNVSVAGNGLAGVFRPLSRFAGCAE